MCDQASGCWLFSHRAVQHKTVTFYESNENEFDEETNEEISTSEHNKTTVLDLPLRQSPGGSLHLQEFLKSKQQPLV